MGYKFIKYLPKDKALQQYYNTKVVMELPFDEVTKDELEEMFRNFLRASGYVERYDLEKEDDER